MPVGAAVALHADRTDIGQQHDRALPDLGVQPGAGQLLAGDRVGVTQNLEAVSGDLADDPDAEAGPRKRLAADDHLGQAELAADRAHLVLEEGAQGLDELELQVFGQSADVVVRLDVRGAGAAAGLDDVGVERALHEEADRLAVGGRLEHERLLGRLERADELASDDLALLLGVADPGECVQELLPRVDRDQPHTGRGDVVVLDLLALVLAQQAVVDEDADQLVADRFVHERRRDGRVDSAGEPADHPTRTDLLADALRPARR